MWPRRRIKAPSLTRVSTVKGRILCFREGQKPAPKARFTTKRRDFRKSRNFHPLRRAPKKRLFCFCGGTPSDFLAPRDNTQTNDPQKRFSFAESKNNPYFGSEKAPLCNARPNPPYDAFTVETCSNVAAAARFCTRMLLVWAGRAACLNRERPRKQHKTDAFGSS